MPITAVSSQTFLLFLYFYLLSHGAAPRRVESAYADSWSHLTLGHSLLHNPVQSVVATNLDIGLAREVSADLSVAHSK